MKCLVYETLEIILSFIVQIVATEKCNVCVYKSKNSIMIYTLNTIIHATPQLKYNGSCMGLHNDV